jgi:hypothetical protein
VANASMTSNLTLIASRSPPVRAPLACTPPVPPVRRLRRQYHHTTAALAAWTAAEIAASAAYAFGAALAASIAAVHVHAHAHTHTHTHTHDHSCHHICMHTSRRSLLPEKGWGWMETGVREDVPCSAREGCHRRSCAKLHSRPPLPLRATGCGLTASATLAVAMYERKQMMPRCK